MDKRLLPLSIVLMLLTLSLTGCIGDAEPETEDGDPVSLGESTDDWPTYYVPSASSLPSCPGANDENLGKLYYVEDVTEFQACTSSGWTTINIGSSGTSTISLNHPPRITAQITPIDDDFHNLTPNGWHYIAMAHWSVIDPEGETVTVGIDTNRDGTIDSYLNSAEGATFVELPWNGSVYTAQIEHHEYGNNGRALHVFRIFDVVAEDASGAISTISVISPALNNQPLRDIFDSSEANDLQVIFPDIPQSDIDWLTAAPNIIPCGPNDGYVHNTFVAEDASASLSGLTEDAMIRISWTCADQDLSWADTSILLSVNGAQPIQCYIPGMVSTPDCLIEEDNDGTSSWSTNEAIFIRESGADICTASCDIDITIMYDGQALSGTTTVTVV